MTPKEIIASALEVKLEQVSDDLGTRSQNKMREFMVRITSGKHKGLFVSTRVSGCWQRIVKQYKGCAILALSSDEAVVLNKEEGVSLLEGFPGVLGTEKIQAQLKALGIESELVVDPPEARAARISAWVAKLHAERERKKTHTAQPFEESPLGQSIPLIDGGTFSN